MTASAPHTLGYAAQIVATAVGLMMVPRLARGGAGGGWRVALLAAGCLAMAAASFLASDPPRLFEDFRIAYHPAGRAVLHDPAALHGLMSQGVSGFVNLPATAYLFAPFGALPLEVGAALFTLVGLALAAAAWVWAARLAGLDATGRWRLALLFAASGPLQYSVREGNTSHMVLFALAAGLALARSGRSAAAATVLGAAAVLKPPLALLGLFFLVRRDWRGAAAFAGTGAAAALVSLVLFGWRENLHWFETCILQFNRQWLAAFNVQSIPAFLLRLQTPQDRLLDWNPFPPPAWARLTAQALVLALFAAAALASLPRRERAAAGPRAEAERLDLQYLLAVCLCVLASPLSWSHYYAWLLLPAAFLLRPGTASPFAWAAILLLTPLVWPLGPDGPSAETAYRTVWVSHFLFAGLAVFGLIALRLARINGVLPAPVWIARAAAVSGAK